MESVTIDIGGTVSRHGVPDPPAVGPHQRRELVGEPESYEWRVIDLTPEELAGLLAEAKSAAIVTIENAHSSALAAGVTVALDAETILQMACGIADIYKMEKGIELAQFLGLSTVDLRGRDDQPYTVTLAEAEQVRTQIGLYYAHHWQLKGARIDAVRAAQTMEELEGLEG